MAGTDRLQWHSREHFLSFAARAMRQVLVDEARKRRYQKRRPSGGRCETLVEGMALSDRPPLHILDLDTVLTKLEERAPRKALVVQLRFFAGMTVPEAALALEVSEATVHREWRSAKAWLAKALEGVRS